MPEIRYLPEQGGQGFVDVIPASTGKTIALPGYLKLNYLGERLVDGKKRDYFIPYEGKWKNRELSITRKSDGGSYLVTGNILGPAKIIFNPVKANLWYGEGSSRVGPIFVQGSGTLNSKPLRDGVHELSVPDEPHLDLTNIFHQEYLVESSYARLWYPIPADQDGDGKDDERFLHCGDISAGCVTVKDIPKWTGICKYLYNRRLRNGVIGTFDNRKN
jgi:hypothetical protein